MLILKSQVLEVAERLRRYDRGETQEQGVFAVETFFHFQGNAQLNHLLWHVGTKVDAAENYATLAGPWAVNHHVNTPADAFRYECEQERQFLLLPDAIEVEVFVANDRTARVVYDGIVVDCEGNDDTNYLQTGFSNYPDDKRDEVDDQAVDEGDHATLEAAPKEGG